MQWCLLTMVFWFEFWRQCLMALLSIFVCYIFQWELVFLKKFITRFNCYSKLQYFNLIVLWFQWGNNCSALVCSNLSLLHVIQRHVLCWSGARRGPEENTEGVWRIHSDHLSEPGQQRAGVLWKVRGNSNRWREVDSFDVKSDDLKLFVICYLSSECSIYR